MVCQVTYFRYFFAVAAVLFFLVGMPMSFLHDGVLQLEDSLHDGSGQLAV